LSLSEFPFDHIAKLLNFFHIIKSADISHLCTLHATLFHSRIAPHQGFGLALQSTSLNHQLLSAMISDVMGATHNISSANAPSIFQKHPHTPENIFSSRDGNN